MDHWEEEDGASVVSCVASDVLLSDDVASKVSWPMFPRACDSPHHPVGCPHPQPAINANREMLEHGGSARRNSLSTFSFSWRRHCPSILSAPAAAACGRLAWWLVIVLSFFILLPACQCASIKSGEERGQNGAASGPGLTSSSTTVLPNSTLPLPASPFVAVVGTDPVSAAVKDVVVNKPAAPLLLTTSTKSADPDVYVKPDIKPDVKPDPKNDTPIAVTIKAPSTADGKTASTSTPTTSTETTTTTVTTTSTTSKPTTTTTTKAAIIDGKLPADDEHDQIKAPPNISVKTDGLPVNGEDRQAEEGSDMEAVDHEDDELMGNVKNSHLDVQGLDTPPRNINVPRGRVVPEDDGQNHAFGYFVVVLVGCVAVIAFWRKRQRILAYLIEGRRSNGRRRTASRNGAAQVQYRKLKTADED